MSTPRVESTLRVRFLVRGAVHGVGFPPAVESLAASLRLGGFVRNGAGIACIEVEGPAEAVRRFAERLPGCAPASARVDEIRTAPVDPVGATSFVVDLVRDDAAAAIAPVPPDRAPCADCLRELEDPSDRRHRHPFVSCSACGPRFTLAREAATNETTRMAYEHRACGTCRREREDPADRRYGAEASTCPLCGPRLSYVEPGAPERAGEDALSGALQAIAAGRIVAVKGAGGFVLTVDATDAGAIARLRARKRQPGKPFAVMARDTSHALEIAALDDAGLAALTSPARPIVVAPAHPGILAAGVAPGLSDVGVVLPPTPLQHLLLRGGPAFQVVTSGNIADEPPVTANAEALERLASVADAFLLHDAAIHTHADDSVVRTAAGRVMPLRRARGFVPELVPVPAVGPTVLALGAERRSTVCLVRDGLAAVSQHIGDLDRPEAFELFEETIRKLARLAGTEPELVAHDLHPAFRSSRWAEASGFPCVPVQHHHAHVASCLAEHGRSGPVLGIAFDGGGLGTDGTWWGGEILEADLRGFRRLGHLRPISLAGGDAAIREPWRVALAALQDAGETEDLLWHVEAPARGRVRRLLEARISTERSTGAGRWFDAVAALCRVRDTITWDGQAAAELEALACRAVLPPYEFELVGDAPFEIDLRPTVKSIAADVRRGRAVPEISARFHETLAQAIHAGCLRALRDGSPQVVALTGGCFQNRILTERTLELLEEDAFEVLRHATVPPNDGGLSLGQAAIASATATGRRSQALWPVRVRQARISRT